MDKPQVEIPTTKQKIIKQILALEWQIKHDDNKTDKEIHEAALHELRMGLKRLEG